MIGTDWELAYILFTAPNCYKCRFWIGTDGCEYTGTAAITCKMYQRRIPWYIENVAIEHTDEEKVMIFKQSRPRPWLDPYTPEQVAAMPERVYQTIYDRWKYQRMKDGHQQKRHKQYRTQHPWCRPIDPALIQQAKPKEYINRMDLGRLDPIKFARVAKQIIDEKVGIV